MSDTIADSVAQNISFVVVCLVVVALCFAVAFLSERIADRGSKSVFTTRTVVVIGLFSAISTILFMFDFPVFFAPGFYKLDFSELPPLIAGFAFGPVCGVMVEFIKILVKLLIKGTSTAFVGDLANFVIGCSFILPATIIYRFKKTRTSAIISCVAGTLSITVFGSLFNAVYLLPAFARLYGTPLDNLIAAGTAINSNITDVTTFVLLAVAPMNLLKGALVSVITVLIYKRIRPLLKGND